MEVQHCRHRILWFKGTRYVQGAKRPTPTQSTCLYYYHDNEASQCVPAVGSSSKRKVFEAPYHGAPQWYVLTSCHKQLTLHTTLFCRCCGFFLGSIIAPPMLRAVSCLLACCLLPVMWHAASCRAASAISGGHWQLTGEFPSGQPSPFPAVPTFHPSSEPEGVPYRLTNPHLLHSRQHHPGPY
jgi:hypothetical protein